MHVKRKDEREYRREYPKHKELRVDTVVRHVELATSERIDSSERKISIAS